MGKRGGNDMNSDLAITQTAGLGSHDNTFIAEQHNHSGLSIIDATQMAFEIFHQYYPQLKDEALRELHNMLEEELEKQNPSVIIPPSPRIAVPTLQGASITPEDDVRRLYAKLLASAMNKDVKEQVHPAFSKIIEQMSSFDAILMKRIVDIRDSIPVANIRFTFGTSYLTEIIPHYYSPYFDVLNDNWATSLSIENLSRLQLINLFSGTVTTFEYDSFRTYPFVMERFEYAKKHNPTRELEIGITNYTIQLNDFGKQFARICMH